MFDLRWFASATVIAIALSAPMPLLAQDTDDESTASDQDDLILVTGVRLVYRGEFALSEIPQSIDIIEDDTLDENGIVRLVDALDLNASVARQNTLGGLFDAFAVRGFAGDENIPTGYLVNGFNGGRGFGGQRDTAGIGNPIDGF